MKRIALKFLPMLAFLLAVGAAFATQASENAVAGILKGKRVSDDQWVVIPANQQYSCQSSSRDCTAEFTPQGAMIPGTLTAGTFTPVNP
jgi:hypothetical protein